MAQLQDPFDACDNPGRTIMRVTAPRVAAELQRASAAMLLVQSDAGAQCTLSWSQWRFIGLLQLFCLVHQCRR